MFVFYSFLKIFLSIFSVDVWLFFDCLLKFNVVGWKNIKLFSLKEKDDFYGNGWTSFLLDLFFICDIYFCK